MKPLLLFLALLCTPLAADELDDGRALLGTKDQAKGVELIRKGIERLGKEPPTAANLHRMGLGRFWMEQDELAIKAFELAAKLDPKNAEHPFMVGIVWMYSDLEKAEQWLRRAAGVDPKSAKVHAELGRVQKLRKKPQEALEATLRACALDPKHVEAHVQAGGLLVGMRRADEALAHFEAALAVAPNHPLARYNAGQLHYDAKRFDKALAHWAAGAKAHPEDYDMNKKALQACYALGRFEQGESYKATLRRLHAAAPPQKRPRDFCFDQFEAGKYKVLAYERFDRSGDLAYHYVFRVYDDANKLVRTVNLESSKVIRELGWMFILGGNEGEVHVNYGVMFKAMPPYAELKRKVIDAAVDGKLGG